MDENLLANELRIAAEKLHDGVWDYDRYTTFLRTRQKQFPKQFQAIQDKNTDARNLVLNDIAFNSAKMQRDPWSKKAFAELPYVVGVPYGHEAGDTMPSNKYGMLQGLTGLEGGPPWMHVPGDASLFTLRHEGSHHVMQDASERDVRLLDLLYAAKLRNVDEFNDTVNWFNSSGGGDLGQEDWDRMVSLFNQLDKQQRPLGPTAARTVKGMFQ